MLKTATLGFNGLVLKTDSSGIVQTTNAGTLPIESEFFDGIYDAVLVLCMHNNELIPLLINESGELL